MSDANEVEGTGFGIQPSPSRVVIVLAAFAIVVAGLKMAAPIVNPFLLSAFISIICSPIVGWLVSKRVPSVIAITGVILVILGGGAVVGAVVGQSLSDFSGQIPLYEEKLKDRSQSLSKGLSDFGIQLDINSLAEYFDPTVAMQVAANTLSGIGAVLTNLFLILLTVMFMLAEAHSFPQKLRAALHNPEHSLAQFAAFSRSVKNYLMIKTLVSAVTGLLVSALLLFLGVDYPGLWGLLAFMMNYVPNIGSIIAAAPVVLLALVQLGFVQAVLVMLGYLLINVIMGNLVEPKFLGKGLGLSTLVVLLSLVFWGWVLGPVGMLLSIPLTMILKIALESNQTTRWLGVLLGESS